MIDDQDRVVAGQADHVAATYAASTIGVDDFDRVARELATWLVKRATPDDERP